MASFAVSPLFKFISNVEFISLQKDFEIRKITEDELALLRGKIFPSPFNEYVPTRFPVLSEREIASCKYVFQFKGESEYADASFQTTSHEINESLLSSLRVFKEGRVTSGITFFSHEAEPKYYPSTKFPVASRTYGIPYVLRDGEVSDFVEFWKKYREISKDNIEAAIRRFSHSYDTMLSKEDRLLDYIIAFEVLYLSAQRVRQKGKTLALAVSNFIGENNEQRKNIHDAIRQAYIKRNSIVHENEKLENVYISGKEIIADDFVRLIEEYLRRSIKRHLDIPVKYEKNRWDLENLKLRYLALKRDLNCLGQFSGNCPICKSHIGTGVFEDRRNKKHIWCASCHRDIFIKIDQNNISWTSSRTCK